MIICADSRWSIVLPSLSLSQPSVSSFTHSERMDGCSQVNHPTPAMERLTGWLMSSTFSSADSTLTNPTTVLAARLDSRAESAAPVIQPIARNLKLSQGSLPMKSQLCPHQSSHQSFSAAAAVLRFQLSSRLKCHLAFVCGSQHEGLGPTLGPSVVLNLPPVTAAAALWLFAARMFY